MEKKPKNNFRAENRKVKFEYEILDSYVAGIQLLGTEIKSIRMGHVGLNDAHCYFDKGELFVKNLRIEPLKDASDNNHDPDRTKKLLLNKQEISKISGKLEKGMSVVVRSIFLNPRGMAKLDIALARGKKTRDKREAIKEREGKREVERTMKNANRK